MFVGLPLHNQESTLSVFNYHALNAVRVSGAVINVIGLVYTSGPHWSGERYTGIVNATLFMCLSSFGL